MRKGLWHLRKEWPIVLAKAVLVLPITFAGCRKAPLCDPELKLNASYIAAIAEPYDLQSTSYYDTRYDMELDEKWPSCAAWDGLAPGASLPIATTFSRDTGACEALFGVIPALPNGERWEEDILAGIQGGFRKENAFVAQGNVVTGSCRGKYKVVLGRPLPQSSVFAPTNPGEVPNLVLGRVYGPFDGDAGAYACPYCADSFVAQLAPGK